MEEKNGGERVVCVTGAGGYVASWLVNLLLSSDYTVHGTVRTDPCDPKYEHLKRLDKASEGLKLFKADLLDYDSIFAAVKGCVGVFHVASPVPSDSVSDPENWYCASKTEAEIEAFEYSRRSGLDVVSVCPTLVLGPMMQSTVNASSLVLIKLLKEGYESTANKLRMIVDVRDLATALLMVFEKPEAEGRYICTSHIIKVRELVDKLASIYPSYNYPRHLVEVAEGDVVSSEKLQKLGWSYRPLEETLVDSMESYKKLGLLG